MKKLQILIIAFLISLAICAFVSMQAKAQGTLDHFGFNAISSPQTAGTSFTITVTAQDSSDATITDYSGTVNFTSTDSHAVLPSNYTFVPGDDGTHSFSVTLETAGSQSITATDTSNSSITGSQSGITVGLASPTLTSTAPSGAVAGTGFTDSSVLAGTSGSNAGGTATYTLYSGTYPSGTQVGSSSVVTVTSGVVPNSASFNVTTAGSYYFTAVYSGDSNNNGASSSVETFTVNTGSLDHFVVSAPSSATAGTAFTLTVTAKDAYGNTVTSYTGTPSLTYSAGSISPSAMNAFVNGVGSTSVTVTTAGLSVTITATAGSHTGTSNSFTVTAASTPTQTPTPSPSPTAAPTSAPTPTPTQSQTLALETMGQYLLVIVAAVILGAVIIWLVIQKRKRPNIIVLN
jgi:hypothetical protein